MLGKAKSPEEAMQILEAHKADITDEELAEIAGGAGYLLTMFRKCPHR